MTFEKSGFEFFDAI